MTGVTALAVWLVIALVLIGVELMTVAFIALYLAVGAIAAGIVGAFGANVGVQVLVFAIVSIVSLIATRKPIKRALDRSPVVASNAQTVVGKHAVVTVALDEGPGHRGQIRVGTEYWSARSTDDHSIEVGATVEVAGIEGVTALVSRVVAAES
jgi:membrane protein implicated in regulation of membrane protease activity